MCHQFCLRKTLSTISNAFPIEFTCAPSQKGSTTLTYNNECDTAAATRGSSDRPVVSLSNGKQIVCDTETDQGGWIVIQARHFCSCIIGPRLGHRQKGDYNVNIYYLNVMFPQRRESGDQDFYLDWDDYKEGFGDLEGNFWLGLETMYQLTST